MNGSVMVSAEVGSHQNVSQSFADTSHRLLENILDFFRRCKEMYQSGQWKLILNTFHH